MLKLVPNFITIHKLGLNGTMSAVIIPGIFNPFGIFIMVQYMKYIPNEYINNARVDGATYSSSLFYIVLPMSKAGIFTVIIFNLIDSWNMIEQPLVFLNDMTKYPLSLYLFDVSNQDLGIGFAASVLFMLPVILISIISRANLIRGVHLSGIKKKL